MRLGLKYRLLPGPYAIVRLAPDSPAPEWAAKGEFISVTRTGDEVSIICPMENIPNGVDSGNCWICFKLEGPFAFSQAGILLSFIEPLSNSGVAIFAISTYDTDYVLVREEFAEATQQTLDKAGHELIG